MPSKIDRIVCRERAPSLLRSAGSSLREEPGRYGHGKQGVLGVTVLVILVVLFAPLHPDPGRRQEGVAMLDRLLRVLPWGAFGRSDGPPVPGEPKQIPAGRSRPPTQPPGAPS